MGKTVGFFKFLWNNARYICTIVFKGFFYQVSYCPLLNTFNFRVDGGCSLALLCFIFVFDYDDFGMHNLESVPESCNFTGQHQQISFFADLFQIITNPLKPLDRDAAGSVIHDRLICLLAGVTKE